MSLLDPEFDGDDGEDVRPAEDEQAAGDRITWAVGDVDVDPAPDEDGE